MVPVAVPPAVAVRVEEEPAGRLVGEAVRAAVRVVAGVTVMVADWLALPAALVQVRV